MLLNLLLGARTGLDRVVPLETPSETQAGRVERMELRAQSPSGEGYFIAPGDDLDDDLDDDDDDISDCDWVFLEMASVHAVDLLSFLAPSAAHCVLVFQAGAFAATFPSLLDVLGMLLI